MTASRIGHFRLTGAVPGTGAPALSALQEELCSAAFNGDLALVRKCLCQGASPDGTNRAGRTPLLSAIENRQLEVIAFLLAQGADPNRSDSYGQTSLHLAVDVAFDGVNQTDEPLSLEEAWHLLKSGASTNLLDGDGRTPLDWARGYGDTALTAFLAVIHGARGVPQSIEPAKLGVPMGENSDVG
jgi:uncharacterized protein